MGNIRNMIKRGNIEFEIPSSWSKRKTKWVVIGLLLFSVAFGMLSVAQDNTVLLSLCIFSAFVAGQIYCIYNYWDKLRKLEKMEECIFLEETEMDGRYDCSQGFHVGHPKGCKPFCKDCRRRTVVK